MPAVKVNRVRVRPLIDERHTDTIPFRRAQRRTWNLSIEGPGGEEHAGSDFHLPIDRNDYLPPARGYLYLAYGGANATVRAEWNDLKQVAGTGQVVSFGSRYELKARLRAADERPAGPDTYVLNFGVQKNRRTDYEPIKALLAFK